MVAPDHSSLPSPPTPLIFPLSPLSPLEPRVEVHIEAPQLEARIPITMRRQSRFREEFDITWHPENEASPGLLPADFGFEGRVRRRSSSPAVSPRTVPVPAHARFSPLRLPHARRPVGTYAGQVDGWARHCESTEDTISPRSPTDRSRHRHDLPADLAYTTCADDIPYWLHQHEDLMVCDTESAATPALMHEDEPTSALPSPLPPSSTASLPLPNTLYEWQWPRRPQSVTQCDCGKRRRQRGDPGLSSHVVNWQERQGQEFVRVGQESPTLGWETGVRVIDVEREVGRRPEGEAGSSGYAGDEEEM